MRAVLVPGVLALLPEYAGLVDPVASLRAACLSAVAWVAEDGPVAVVGTEQGRRVGASLLAAGGFETGARAPSSTTGSGRLVVGNGSAKRRDTSPGYVDPRAVPFDEELGARLRAGDLAGIDQELAGELWADTVALGELAAVLPAGCGATIDYEDDPYGVQYWVGRWAW